MCHTRVHFHVKYQPLKIPVAINFVFLFATSFKVCAKLRNLEKDLEYIWSRDKFVRRKYLMQEMYQNYTEGEEWTLPDVSILNKCMLGWGP